MSADREMLNHDRSLALLAGMTTGRVVYTTDALPAVLPVRFRLAADGSLLLDARFPTDLLRATDGGVIAFETGEIDGADGRGWSVTVPGRAGVGTGQERRAAAAALGAVLRLRPELVTGRRLGVPPQAPHGPGA